jgi:hypothetical protein
MSTKTNFNNVYLCDSNNNKIQTLGEKNNLLFHFHEKETETARAKCTMTAAIVG